MAAATGASLSGAGTAWNGNMAREDQPVPAVVTCATVPAVTLWALWAQVAE